MNHIKISPAKLIPISFESARPSTRFPAMETTIMAKKIPVKLLITELDRRILKEKDESLNTAATVMEIKHAHIMGSTIRANK